MHATLEDYQNYTTLITANAADRRRILREELENGLKERGVLETEYGQIQLAHFDSQSETLQEEQQKLSDKINTILRNKFVYGQTLNAEEELELEAHLERLEEITLTKQQEAFEKEISQKYEILK